MTGARLVATAWKLAGVAGRPGGDAARAPPGYSYSKGMEYEFTFVDSSLVICRGFGVASVQGFVNSAEAMTSDPRWHPGVDSINDYTHVDTSQVTASDVVLIASGEGERSDQIGPGRAAIVVGADSPSRYGLARMFEAYIEPLAEATFRAFYTYDEALAWLRGPDFSLPEEVVRKLAQPPSGAATESN